MSQYDVGAGGLLAAKSPATVSTATSPRGVGVSPDGKSVYVANNTGPPGKVSQYDVGAGGLLTAKSPATVDAGDGAWLIALSPNQGPVASFSASAAAAGAATGFDGSGSSDADGTIARYDWDFGDGAQAPNGGPTPTHTYAAAGDYTVALTVTDDAGCSMSFVFTGQTAHCTGGAAARTTRTVTVPPSGGGGGDGGGGGGGGGDGGGDGGGGGATDVPPAAADLSDSPSSIRVNRKRRFRFPFDATAGLTGKAVFKSIRRVKVSARRRVVLARKAFTVPTNGEVKLKLRMSKKKFRILKRERRIRTRVTVTLVNAAGLTSTASKRVKLKAPR